MQGLPFETVTQFVALGLTLIAGLCLGYALAPGSGKWRRLYEEVEIDAAQRLDLADSNLHDAVQRICVLEAENARLSGVSQRDGSYMVPASTLAAMAAEAVAREDESNGAMELSSEWEVAAEETDATAGVDTGMQPKTEQRTRAKSRAKNASRGEPARSESVTSPPPPNVDAA